MVERKLAAETGGLIAKQCRFTLQSKQAPSSQLVDPPAIGGEEGRGKVEPEESSRFAINPPAFALLSYFPR